MPQKTTKTLTALAAAALLLTGCSGGSQYSDLDDLVSAWEDHAGQQCIKGPGSGTREGYEFVECTDITTIFFYDTPEAMEGHDEYVTKIFKAGGTQKDFLEGENWSINFNGEYGAGMQEALGGEIVTVG